MPEVAGSVVVSIGGDIAPFEAALARARAAADAFNAQMTQKLGGGSSAGLEKLATIGTQAGATLAKLTTQSGESAAAMAKLAATSEVANAALKVMGAGPALATGTVSAREFAKAMEATGGNLAKISPQMLGLVAANDAVSVSNKAGKVAAEAIAVAHGHAGTAAGLGATQMMALFHATRSATEQLALGVSPTQALVGQLSHLSYVASGPGGVKGVFTGIGDMVGGVISRFPVATAALAALAVGFLGLQHEINASQSVSVGLGTTMIATFDVIRDALFGQLKPAIDAVSPWFKMAWDTVLTDLKFVINGIIGSYVGAFDAIKATWSLLPSAIGDLVYQAADLTVKGVESMINAVIEKINTFVGTAYNSISGLAGKVGIDLGEFTKIDPIGEGGVTNPYAGAASGAADTAKDAFGAGYNQDFAGGAYDAIRSKAIQLQLAKNADDATGGSKADPFRDLLKSTQNQIDKLKEESLTYGMVGASADAFAKYQDLVAKATDHGRTITETQNKELLKLADAYGAAKEAAAALKLIDDQMFDRSQLGRTQNEQQVYGDLRSKGINIDSAVGQQAAGYERTTLALTDMKAAAGDALGVFLSDLRNGVSVWKSFGDAALSVLDKIVAKIEDQLVSALFSAQNAGGGAGGIFSSLLGIFGLGGGGLNVFPAAPGLGTGGLFAKGGTFENGISGFSNTIVDRPAQFRFASGAGLMGEAGPEGILPLRKDSSGRLGVMATTSAANANQAPAANPAANQNMHITVGWSQSADGNLKPFIESVSQGTASKTVAAYDQQMPDRMKQINADPRAR